MGVRMAHPDPTARITAFLGDGTFLMAPTELVTAAQEGLPITLVIPENHGYQVIHRLQMFRNGREFGNEFRYRTQPLELADAAEVDKAARLDGDYLQVDLVQIAAGLGAKALRADTAAELRAAPGRDPRPPGHRRHRRAGDPARRPAAGRGVVGRRPGRGVRGRHRAAAARRVRAGPQDPAVVRMSPRRCTGPLNDGALARVGPRRRHHARAPSSAPHPRSPPRSAPPPGSTGCCWISSTAPAARSRSATSFPPPVPTECRPWSGSRPARANPDGSGAGRAVPRESCCPAWTVPLQVAGRDPHLRFPPRGDRGVATYNRACRFGLDPGALDRADDEILVRRADRIRGSRRGGRRDRRGRRCRRAVHRSPRPAATTSVSPATPPRRRSSRPSDTVLAAAQRHGKAGGLLVNDGAAAAAAPRTGLDVRRPSAPTPPCSPRPRPVGARPRPPRHPLILPNTSHRKRTQSWLDTSTTRASPRSVSA